MNEAYAYKNTPEILEYSSSGGAFLRLAELFFERCGEQKGYVYGAAFDEEFGVRHSAAANIIECKKFCGSKYIQSNLGGCYVEIAERLRQGEHVLFTGTPCQVGGLKLYLERQTVQMQNLILADIICHGAPNDKFWREYVKYMEKEKNSKLVSFSFRHKPYGWKGYPIYAEFENGVKRINTLDVSTYQNLFREGLLMRETCFQCKYPGNFQSDLTLGDFWGVELCKPEIPTKGGVSLVIAHSEKGIDLMSEIEHQTEIRKDLLSKVEGEYYLQCNHNLLHVTQKPDRYESFWKDYQEKGMEYVLKKYAGDNFAGRCKFYTKRFLRDTGLLTCIKKVLKKA